MKLIDKDEVVAEIEKLIEEPAPSHDQQCPWEDGYYCGLYKAESIIDSLEVKEVDLDEEFDRYCDNLYLIDLENEPYAELFECAKHFFELGLKAGG